MITCTLFRLEWEEIEFYVVIKALILLTTFNSQRSFLNLSIIFPELWIWSQATQRLTLFVWVQFMLMLDSIKLQYTMVPHPNSTARTKASSHTPRPRVHAVTARRHALWHSLHSVCVFITIEFHVHFSDLIYVAWVGCRFSKDRCLHSTLFTIPTLLL